MCDVHPELPGCNLHVNFRIKISTLVWTEQLLSIQAVHFTFQQTQQFPAALPTINSLRDSETEMTKTRNKMKKV